RLPVGGQAAGEALDSLGGLFGEQLGGDQEPATVELLRVEACLAASGDAEEAVVVLHEPGIAGDIPDGAGDGGVAGDVGAKVGPEGQLLKRIGPELAGRNAALGLADRVFLERGKPEDTVF